MEVIYVDGGFIQRKENLFISLVYAPETSSPCFMYTTNIYFIWYTYKHIDFTHIHLYDPTTSILYKYINLSSWG